MFYRRDVGERFDWDARKTKFLITFGDGVFIERRNTPPRNITWQAALVAGIAMMFLFF